MKSSFGLGQIEGLYVMSVDYNFPCTLKMRPEFDSIAVEDQLLTEFIKIVRCCDNKVNIQYDTTFSLCDYYVSILSFIHPFIETRTNTSPVVPLFYFFHSRKFQETHETFWYFVGEKLNKIKQEHFHRD